MTSLMFKLSAKEHTHHGLANLLFSIMLTNNSHTSLAQFNMLS